MHIRLEKKRLHLQKPGILLAGLLAGGMCFLSGCGAPPGPGGGAVGMGPPGAGSPPTGGSSLRLQPPVSPIKPASSLLTPQTSPSSLARKPEAPFPKKDAKDEGKDKSEKKDEKSLDPSKADSKTPVDTVENAGNTINLAAAIILAEANPFMDRLPKPLKPQTTDSGTGAAVSATPVEIDPFQDVTLMGIIYNPQKPMALVSLQETEGNKSQMVGNGTTIPGGTHSFRVIKINHDNIELQLLDDKKKEKRTINLPSIINFVPQGKSQTTPDSSKSDISAPDKGSNEDDTTSRGKTNSASEQGGKSPHEHSNRPKAPALELQNLQKLMSGQ